jgi:hypothetical protein
MAIRTVKKVKFLKGSTNLGTTPRFPGISGTVVSRAANSNNRRVKVRG